MKDFYLICILDAKIYLYNQNKRKDEKNKQNQPMEPI